MVKGPNSTFPLDKEKNILYIIERMQLLCCHCKGVKYPSLVILSVIPIYLPGARLPDGQGRQVGME